MSRNSILPNLNVSHRLLPSSKAIMGLLLVAIVLVGCQSLVLNDSSPGIPASRKKSEKTDIASSTAASSKEPKKDMRIGGSGLMLGKTDNLAYDDHSFAELLTGLFQEQKLATVEHLVKTYPDIAMSLLMYGPCGDLDLAHSLQLAQIVDHFWSENSSAPEAWTRYARLGQNSNPNEKSFHRLRGQFLDLLTNNSPEAALKLKLYEAARTSNSDLAILESFRLEASAHQILGNHKKSAQLLETGIAKYQSGYPVQCSRLMLLMSDATRHMGDTAQASAFWNSATELESQTMKTRQFYAPAFWKQAAFQRPVDLDWPSPVVANFREILEQSGLRFPELLSTDAYRESILWAVVGVQSLKRHESQNAILAFKKSEGLITSAELKNELLLQLANSMLDAGQAGPASAILFRLTTQPGVIASRSRAILGSLKLQHGSIEQGLNLLTSALASADKWPIEEKLRAESDLALATLIRSEESRGLRLLEDSVQQFANHGLFGHAVQALSNIARYHETKQNPVKHSHSLQRLKEFETSGLIAPAS